MKDIIEAATRRAAILHASAAWGSDVDGHLMGRLVECIEAARAEERERIVTWLRSNAMGQRWRELADAIERGEHLK